MDDVPPLLADPDAEDGLAPALIDAFITRWSAAAGTERANYQPFLSEFPIRRVRRPAVE